MLWGPTVTRIIVILRKMMCSSYCTVLQSLWSDGWFPNRWSGHKTFKTPQAGSEMFWLRTLTIRHAFLLLFQAVVFDCGSESAGGTVALAMIASLVLLPGSNFLTESPPNASHMGEIGWPITTINAGGAWCKAKSPTNPSEIPYDSNHDWHYWAAPTTSWLRTNGN